MSSEAAGKNVKVSVLGNGLPSSCSLPASTPSPRRAATVIIIITVIVMITIIVIIIIIIIIIIVLVIEREEAKRSFE
ncbi:unnamed protein product, partial [Symbiodinium sp. KB8]